MPPKKKRPKMCIRKPPRPEIRPAVMPPIVAMKKRRELASKMKKIGGVPKKMA